MLRTNLSFLEYINQLKNSTLGKNNITYKTFLKGKKILFQGEKAHYVMLIKEGITKVFISEPNEKEYILEFLGKGEIIGEIELIRKIPCLCNVEAMTDVTVYTIQISYFENLLKTDLALNNLLNDEFAQRIVNTCKRASYQQLYTTEHNLGKLLDMLQKQEIEISKEEMAAYLGITIRSLNRAFKNLK